MPRAERRHQVHDARRQVVGRGLEVDPLLRVPMPLLRRPDLPRHPVAGVQVELPDLGRGDVDVVRARHDIAIHSYEVASQIGVGVDRLMDPARLLGEVSVERADHAPGVCRSILMELDGVAPVQRDDRPALRGRELQDLGIQKSAAVMAWCPRRRSSSTTGSGRFSVANDRKHLEMAIDIARPCARLVAGP